MNNVSPSIRLPIITVSEQKCFQRCPREHLYSYRLGVRPVVLPEALRFGALLRPCLDAWWRAAGAGAPREQWLAAALAEIAPEEDDFDRGRVEELVRGYHARWANEELEVLKVDVAFETPLVNPATGASSRTFRLGDTIRALVRRPDGRVFVVQHRTTSEDIGPAADYWRRLRLDAQVSTYVVGARALGHDVAACLYDVVGRVKLVPYEATPLETRKYTKEGKLYANQRERAETAAEYRERVRAHVAANADRYFARCEVARTDEDERDAAFDLWQTVRAIADAGRLKRSPRNEQSCVRYGRTCAYFEVCTRAASLEDDTKFRRKATEGDDGMVEHAA